MEKKREVFADKRGLHRQFHGRDHAKTSANFSRSSSLSRRELEAAVPMTRSNTHPQILSRVRTPWLNLEMPTFFSRKVSPGESKSHEKLLVNVTVWQSIGALRVLISTHATVLDVIKVAVELYAKEGRRPFLNSDPLSFDLHFSQFTIDCLNLNDNVKDLGSRNFFLCPKKKTSIGDFSCRTEMVKSSTTLESWKKLIDCFVLLP
ncbi:uncharacterized protein At4g22758 [Cryptomeria japonica]|uniref:uncharacterized protein At4g22758 n=1 Tax=Cryptomeria japonica TaxID=3369 RepID=UPI0025AD3D40|nr:uncharacterized protein At4g22758 [Cryptomeria japonica]